MIFIFPDRLIKKFGYKAKNLDFLLTSVACIDSPHQLCGSGFSSLSNTQVIMTEFFVPQPFPITTTTTTDQNSNLGVQATGRHYTPTYDIPYTENYGQVSNSFWGAWHRFCGASQTFLHSLVQLSTSPQSHKGRKFIVLQPESKFTVCNHMRVSNKPLISQL